MFLWRISNYSTLDGRGGLFAPGRWHSQGHAVVYLAESPAGALAEVLVHLELDPADLPKSYKLLKCEAPDSVALRHVVPEQLPRGWQADLVTTQTIGDEWLNFGKTALLRVPSAIIPETANVLLNPIHRDASQVRSIWHKEYPWDARLFQKES